MASTKWSYINSIVCAIKDSFRKNSALPRSSGISRTEKKTYGTAINIEPLDVAEVERAWIEKAKENIEFLNANLKCYSILFRVQRRELVTEGDAIN